MENICIILLLLMVSIMIGIIIYELVKSIKNVHLINTLSKKAIPGTYWNNDLKLETNPFTEVHRVVIEKIKINSEGELYILVRELGSNYTTDYNFNDFIRIFKYRPE